MDQANAIGRQGDLLCHLSTDLRRFKTLTIGHPVLMGRKTYESLPVRPLPNRRNIVLTTDTSVAWPLVEVVHTIEEALLAIRDQQQEVFIIGGGSIYRQFLPYANRLYLTRIRHTFPDADTFFPDINSSEWQQVSIERGTRSDRDAYDFDFIDLQRI
mgnify:CR=1 FL=1